MERDPTAAFAQLKQWECPDSTCSTIDPPLILAAGQGSHLYDLKGREYIDLCAGFGSLALGHHHPSLKALLREASEEPLLIHAMGDVYPSCDKIDFLATLFSHLPPHLKKASLALTGSGGVEAALKTAMIHTHKAGFIAFEGSYHGVDLGTLPVTHRRDFRSFFQSFLREDQVLFLPFEASEEEVEAAIKKLSLSPYGFSGILVEPIQGRAGVRLAREGFLAELKSLCELYEGLLIFDEIFVGLGRAGKISFSEEVAADISVFGKALGGGMPLSASVGTDEVMTSWPDCQKEALHTGTFFGHPLTLRIAKATLTQIIANDLPNRAFHLGNEALAFLKAELSSDPSVKDIRGQGLMLGILGERAGFGADLMHALREKGIIALAAGPEGEVLSITPALNIEKELLWQAFETLASSVKTLR